MREMLIFSLLLIVVFAGLIVYQEHTKEVVPPITYLNEFDTYYCPNESSFSVQHSDTGANVRLSLSGVQYVLNKIEGSSGFEYENEQNGVSFIKNGEEASVLLPGSEEIECSLNTVEEQSVKTESIRVHQPLPDELIATPVNLRGEARGYWFFEGTAPVAVTNDRGAIIGQGFITAEDDWMTEDFVSFAGTVHFSLPEGVASTSGSVIFIKENPSGLPQNDDAMIVPISF